MKERPLLVQLTWPNTPLRLISGLTLALLPFHFSLWLLLLHIISRWQFPLDFWLKALVTSNSLFSWYFLSEEHLAPCKPFWWRMHSFVIVRQIQCLDYKLRKLKIQENYFKIFQNFPWMYLIYVLFEFPAAILLMTYLCGTTSVMESKSALQMFYLTLPACIMWSD